LRILILDAVYLEFLDAVYREHPGLEERTSAEQLSTIYAYGFARSDFLVQNLRRLGHETDQVLVNAQHVQRAVARELGLRPPPLEGRWMRRVQRVSREVRRRLGGLAPAQGAEAMEVVAAQIERFDPDVILNTELLQFPPEFLRRVRGSRRLVGECAYPVSETLDVRAYDFMVSAVPHFVARFAAAGVEAALWHHAFEPSVLGRLGETPRPEGIVFVGSVSRHHSERRELLEHVAGAVPIRFFGNVGWLPLGSTLRGHFKPPLWGYAMYRVLQRARIALNVHINMASKYAANLRLYEATGVGTLLLTDWKENLPEMFEVGKEIVAFRTAEECVELAHYYLTHEAESAAIAAAGQRRTLRDHTYARRATQLLELLEERTVAVANR
jgi:spore maturation protein CgeB